MAYEPNMLKWVNGSFARVLRPVVETNLGIKFWIGGVDREAKDMFNEDNAVMRVNGPWYYPYNGEERYRIEVMVLLTDLNSPTDNAYLGMQRGGQVAEALAKPIPLYRLGDGDDQIGCYDIDRKDRDYVRLINYAVIEKDTRIQQLAVLVKYEITL